MTEAAPIWPQPAPPSPPDRIDYAREVRFGIVMYGGVSLAIYINGVANELYEMACATPKVEGQPPAKGSTREVYARLSCLLRNARLREDYKAHLVRPDSPDPFAGGQLPVDGDRVRFVVDVIAGTSAGGINGVFLAKALANGQAFASLKRMWVDEGDIDLLLNDKQSYDGIAYAKTGEPPQSLLNSDRMFLKLLKAMEDMAPAVAAIGDGESALSDELDLYVTTTDIRGAVVPLRLFDKVVHEKRHKQVYHFQYAAAKGRSLHNDFVATNTPFLAFAARCTSSFPFAFEPMQVIDAQRLMAARPGGASVDFTPWKGFFTGLSTDDTAGDRWTRRAFGDGGYLDNKPFSYVVEALSWRLATVPIERKLIYIEPAPSHPELEQQNFAHKPNAIENAVEALTGIPQYETIREDLEAVLLRNRRIERVERIVRMVESDVEEAGEEPFARVLLEKGKVPDWEKLDIGDLIDYYGVAFLPYWRLRMTTVTDDLADRLADRWGVDRHSDRLYAMRALVRAWREAHFFEHKKEASATRTESINGFVNAFDMKYRVRRVGFLLRKTHQLMRVAHRLDSPGTVHEASTDTEDALLARLVKKVPGLDTMRTGAIVDALKSLRVGFADALAELRGITWPDTDAAPAHITNDDRELLGRVLGLLIGETLAQPLTQLAGLDGQSVRIAIDRLPLPSPLRTLQENVFEGAQGLFALAGAGRKTRLQAQLEGDIANVRLDFASYIGQRDSATTPKLRARDLLGNPKLGTEPVTTTENTDEKVNPDACKVVATVEPVLLERFAAALNTLEGIAIRRFLAEYYLRFDEYDQMTFPLYYDTGTGEPSTVEVVRISPEDAPSLIDEAGSKRRKLAGTTLFNFGGFLDAQWRRNDIMWGRLDGCERLLDTLLPDDVALRCALRGQAQRAILREEMNPPCYDELVQRFAAALADEKQATLKAAFDKLWPKLGSDDAQRQTRTALALQAVLGDEGLIAYVRDHYEVRRVLDNEKSLKTASRAITITGRILEQIEQDQRANASRMVWVTRAGRSMQALLAVSTPGSLLQRLWHHWLFLLYLFESLVLIGGVIFSANGTRNFALTAFALTFAAHLASLLAGDTMLRQWGRARIAAGAVAVALLVLVGVGITGLLRVGPMTMLCGDRSVATPRTWLGEKVCGHDPIDAPH